MIDFSFTKGSIYSGPVANGLHEIIKGLHPSSVAIVADENTSKLCVPMLQKHVRSFEMLVIPAGEASKSLETCNRIWSFLVSIKADRDTLLLNTGGGVVCDIGGFSAACFQRGIRFAHIPTTVLSMADAAIGGKTGIDFQGLKNYIGLVSHPSFIWIDTAFLETLPEKEIRSGLAEVVKHAIIGSSDLWEYLRSISHLRDIHWQVLFEKNHPVKVNIVEADPYEKGLRKVLNFGHTVGHALESYYLSQSLPVTHGQCVAAGMLVEARISYALGLLDAGELNDIKETITRLLEMPETTMPGFEVLFNWLSKDKKKSGGFVGFSLPDRIGQCGWDIPVEEAAIKDAYLWFIQASTAS